MSINDIGEEERKQRGRPIGFRLSEESRRAISRSKEGQTHSQETKDKISRSLILYFKKLNPLSEEIEKRYCGINDEINCAWVQNVKQDLDDLTDVMTDKALRNTRRIEVTYGNIIEYFGHNITPEVITLFKEFCRLNDLDPAEALDNM